MSLAAEATYVLDLCARIAAFSDVPGTITRLFLSPTTRDVHALLTSEMEALGLSVRTDRIGNLRGFYPAAAPDAPVLLLGSHIDTVPDAGRYDGILGVGCALALVRALGGRRLAYALEIIAFSEEEGIRFKLPFLGSRALANTLAPEDLERADEAGITVAEALRAYALPASTVPGLHDCVPTPGTFAFLELHIEQGPVLEGLALPLGIVSEIVGQTRRQFTFFGQANHAGTTPMQQRKDALVAAAEFIVLVEAFARERPPLVATVGSVGVAPGASNVVPGMATLNVDLRHSSDALRVTAIEELVQLAAGIASRRGLRFGARERSAQASVAMNPQLIEALSHAAAACGFPVHTMASGAGHDAMIVAGILPAAMLFLRTPGGLSHHPDESVRGEDIAAALATSLHFLLHLDPATISPSQTF